MLDLSFSTSASSASVQGDRILTRLCSRLSCFFPSPLIRGNTIILMDSGSVTTATFIYWLTLKPPISLIAMPCSRKKTYHKMWITNCRDVQALIFLWSQSRAFLVLSFWGSQSRSFFRLPFWGEPEPELFSFCLFGGAGARASKARQARLELEPSFSFLF